MFHLAQFQFLFEIIGSNADVSSVHIQFLPALAASIYFTILMENKRVVGHVATKGLSEFRFRGKIVKM
jgi:hypothetical protein